MGPPARSLAADAHGCIMVRIPEDYVFDDPPNTRLWRDGATTGRLDSDRLVRWRLSRGRHRLTRGCRSARPLDRCTIERPSKWKDDNMSKLRLDKKSPIQGWGEGATMIPYRNAGAPSSPLLPHGEKE